MGIQTARPIRLVAPMALTSTCNRSALDPSPYPTLNPTNQLPCYPLSIISSPSYTLHYTFFIIHSPACTSIAHILQYKTSSAHILQDIPFNMHSPLYILYYTFSSIHFSSIHSPVYILQHTLPQHIHSPV